MWDDNKESPIFERRPEWFDGSFALPVSKTNDIIKWESNKAVFKLLSRKFPRAHAKKQLTDISGLALTWTKREVKTRQTFKASTTGENVAPLVFQLDADADWLSAATTLRGLKKTKFSQKGLDTPDLVSPTMQAELIQTWLDDPQHPVTEAARPVLLHYCELNDSEMLYVKELLRVYDAARCYFVQWVINDEFKALVNGARQSALSKSLPFTWVHVEKEILTTLLDLQTMARLLQFANRRRPADTSAKLWASTRIAERAQMEDHLSPTPIELPESLWLTAVVGHMSDLELNTIGLPTIADELNDLDDNDEPKWTLDKLKNAIEACTKPPPLPRRDYTSHQTHRPIRNPTTQD
jgi:hypothetical protein